jgi:hypothetical protein
MRERTWDFCSTVREDSRSRAEQWHDFSGAPYLLNTAHVVEVVAEN